MATKKYLELKEFSAEELANELKETKVQYQKQKFDHALKGLDNPLLLRDIRRDVARLQSEVRRREIEAMDSDAIAKRSKIRLRRRK